MIPVTVDGPLKELHRIVSLSELPIGRSHLGTHTADTGIALECGGPPLWFLIHHLQQVSATPLRSGQLLDHKGYAEIRPVETEWLPYDINKSVTITQHSNSKIPSY